MRRALLGLLGVGVGVSVSLASCAQPPTRELEMTAARVESARRLDAARFAPELFAEAESALSQAKELVAEGKDYRGAIQAMALASLRADEASSRAVEQRRVTEQKLRHLLLDLESLLEIAASRGASREAPAELAGLRARYQSVRDLAIANDLPGALEAGSALRPEILDFEERFRR